MLGIPVCLWRERMETPQLFRNQACRVILCKHESWLRSYWNSSVYLITICFGDVFLTPSIKLSLVSVLDPSSRQKMRVPPTRYLTSQGKLECSAALKVPCTCRKIAGGSDGEPPAPFSSHRRAIPVARLQCIGRGRTRAFVSVERLEKESEACSFFFSTVLVV